MNAVPPWLSDSGPRAVIGIHRAEGNAVTAVAADDAVCTMLADEPGVVPTR